MACVVKLCRRYGLIPICHSSIIHHHHPPAVITRKYEDQCGCSTGCSCPNRKWAIIPVQIITFIALLSSIFSTIDCRLVRIPNTLETGIDNFTIYILYNGTNPTGMINNNATTRSLGLFGWENIDGSCSYERYEGSAGSEEEENPFPVLQQYYQFVGSELYSIMIVAVVVIALGLIVLLWMLCLLPCVAHSRRYRYILAGILMLILPLLQSLTFRILRTDVCLEKKCDLDQCSYQIIAATIFYFIAGCILCMGTKDFPGNPYKQQNPNPVTKIIATMRSYFVKSSDTAAISHEESNDNNNNNNNNHYGSPTTIDGAIMVQNNGFADAVEIPVESEFIDRSLIEVEDTFSTPRLLLTTRDWTNLINPTATTSSTTNVTTTTRNENTDDTVDITTSREDLPPPSCGV